MIIGLLAIFTLVHDPSGDYVGYYENQSSDTISGMMSNQGYAFDFIDQPTYDAFQKSHPFIVTQDTATLAAKDQAISDAKNTKLDAQTRLDALTKALGL